MTNVDHEPSLMEVASGLPDEGSLLDRLKEASAETAERTEADIKVPMFSSSDITLFARYQQLDGKVMQRQARKVQVEFKTDYERNLYGSIDLMITACVGFYVDAGEGLQPLTYEGRHITGYNQDLADALKLSVDPAHPARSIVLALFKGNEVALGAHNMRLGRWMTDPSIDPNLDLIQNP